MKKAITITVTAIITLVIVLGSIALYMHFTKNDIKPDINAVESGVIESEKYGKFVIPEENMFINPNMSILGFGNNTDFTYMYEEIAKELADNSNEDYQEYLENNQFLLQFYSENAKQIYSHFNTYEKYTTYINSELYPFYDTPAYVGVKSDELYLKLKDNKLQFDERKLMSSTEMHMPYMFFNFKVGLKSELPTLTENDYHLPYSFNSLGETPGTTIYKLNIKCLSKKVELKVGDETYNYHLPVSIISDKGYPLTEKIYNEITQGK